VGVVLAACAAGCGAGDEPALGDVGSSLDRGGSSSSEQDGTGDGATAPAADDDRDSHDTDADTHTSSGGEQTDTETGSAGQGDPEAPTNEEPIELPLASPDEGPAAGNADGDCAVPIEARPVDTSQPDRVVGNGSAASCTADAFIDAVALGGVITFDCGPDPVVITLDRPAKVVNDASDDVVIDGGGKVTLSGGGTSRILYMNTCDSEQHWTSAHCDNQETPRLTVQNLTFIDANSKGEDEYDGGGAIWVRGGRFKVIGSRFFNNTCADTGPDVGGGALRVFSQYEGRPVYVVGSTFGGAEGLGNVCSNGGGISSIEVSWSIYNSLFSHNRAVGEGGNPAQDGTPGGGSGGAIYNDGETMTLSVCGTRIEENEVNAYGSAIFFVSNNHDGTLRVEDSWVRNNHGGDWNVLPGISMHDDTVQITTGSIIE
jgi:polymorphic membrane protein